MDSSKTQRLLISLAATLCLILIHSAQANSGDSGDAYEVLQHYRLPVGLLPEGVFSHELDMPTGKFTAYLKDSCSFSLSKYQLQYKSTIQGYLSTDKLSNVQGMSVKVFHVWMNIREIIRRGNHIEFSVWVGKAGLPVGYFQESPQCGRDLKAQKLMTN